MCAYLQHDFDLEDSHGAAIQSQALSHSWRPQSLYDSSTSFLPRMLTADGPYCIPPAEVSAIMEEVCGSLSPEEPTPALLLPEIPAAGAIRRHLSGRLMVFFCKPKRIRSRPQVSRLCDAWDRLRQGILFHQLQ